MPNGEQLMVFKSIMVPLSSGLSSPSEVAVQKDIGMVHRYGQKWQQTDHPSPKLSVHHFRCPYIIYAHCSMQLFILECWTPKMKAICFFEKLATTYQLTWSNIPEYSNLQAKICSNQYNL